MNYSQDAFVKLMEEVERQGGEHLDELCEDRIFRIPMQRGGEKKPFRSVRCGSAAKFEIPYVPENRSNAEEFAVLTACAVDDNMGAWPRFHEAVGWEGVTT